MRQTLPLLLIAGLLTACGSDPPPTPAADTAPVTTPAPAPAPVDDAEDVPATGSLAARESAAEPSSTVDYDCEGMRMTVAFENEGEVAKFIVDDVTHALDTASADSGARYTDDAGNQLWTHGTDEARLSLAGQSERNCTRVY
ncbi:MULTISPECIES: MliC family protein [Luteimonas]|uniref:MliC family protein n=1 Tax=Luteimonas TaxID=83614 RepID=UPI000C7AFCD0|nr:MULTISPECIES: MliC family protein [Luteimonas]